MLAPRGSDDVADVDRLGRVRSARRMRPVAVVDLDRDGRAAGRAASRAQRVDGVDAPVPELGLERARASSSARPRSGSSRYGTFASAPTASSIHSGTRPAAPRSGSDEPAVAPTTGFVKPSSAAPTATGIASGRDAPRQERKRRCGDDDPEPVRSCTSPTSPLSRIVSRWNANSVSVLTGSDPSCSGLRSMRLDRQHERERDEDRDGDPEPRPRHAVPEPDHEREEHRRQRVEAVALDDVLGHAGREDADLEQARRRPPRRATATNERSASVCSRPAAALPHEQHERTPRRRIPAASTNSPAFRYVQRITSCSGYFARLGGPGTGRARSRAAGRGPPSRRRSRPQARARRPTAPARWTTRRRSSSRGTPARQSSASLSTAAPTKTGSRTRLW